MTEQRMLNVRVDDRIMAALAERASQLDVTISEIVRTLIDEGLAIKRNMNLRDPEGERITIPVTRIESYKFYEYFSKHDPRLSEIIDFFASYGPGSVMDCDAKQANVATVLVRLEKLHDLLDDKAEAIMRELAVNGEVFVMANIDCPTCDGQDGLCKHYEGSVQSISILDPSSVEVSINGLIPDMNRAYYLIPSKDLKKIVSSKTPKEIYERLPKTILSSILDGTPILLNPQAIAHGKLGGSNYEAYGTSMIRGMLPELIKNDKRRQKGESAEPLEINEEVLLQRIAKGRRVTAEIFEKFLNLQADMWGIPKISVRWLNDHLPSFDSDSLEEK